MPGNVSSLGVLVEVAEHLRPGSRPSSGIGGPGRDVHQPPERQRDADHDPASTPADSTPTIAATAIQKSNRVTR